VGVNRFRIDEPPVEGLLKVDDSLRKERIELLRAHREKRDAAACDAALAGLKASAAGEKDKLMPRIVDSVEAGASIGEICAALEEVFGRFQE
jgi:methylmalonyl-CoA mutase N-terminal domain/subunit